MLLLLLLEIRATLQIAQSILRHMVNIFTTPYDDGIVLASRNFFHSSKDRNLFRANLLLNAIRH